MVLVSCEAFDNYPPGLADRLLCRTAALPGSTFLTAQLLRQRWIRHLAMTFGALSKRRVPEGLFWSWIHPLRHNSKVRRDLLRNVPELQLLLAWADQQSTFVGSVLVISDPGQTHSPLKTEESPTSEAGGAPSGREPWLTAPEGV